MSDNPTPPPGRNPQEPHGGDAGGRAPLWWTGPSVEQPEYLTPGSTTPGSPTAGRPHGGPAHQGGPVPGDGPGLSGPPSGAPQHNGPSYGGPPPGGYPRSGPGQIGPGHTNPAQSAPGHSGPGQSGPGSSGPAPGGPRQPSPWMSTPPAPYQQPRPPAPQQGQSQSPGQGPGESGVPLNWQYPPIPIPQPPGPGRRRGPGGRSKGLLILAVSLAVLVIGTGVTLAVRGGDDPTSVPVAGETPTPTPTSTPTPTPTKSSKPAPKSKPITKPRPPTAFEMAARNKIYRSGPLQASQCAEPPFRPTTYAATRAYYNRMLPCLNRTWWLSLGKVGIKYRPPKVVVYAGTLKTPCGVERAERAYYCGGNETIYMPWQLDAKNYKINPVYTRAWMLNTFAHEYGHHVQQVTGIFKASFARQFTMGNMNSRLLESRRRELQASCLGSAYLGANAAYTPMRGPLLATWRAAVANAGDEFSRTKVRDHGSMKNHNFWSLRGYNSKNPAMCNTWTASGSVLS